jgi:hypothetical protein
MMHTATAAMIASDQSHLPATLFACSQQGGRAAAARRSRIGIALRETQNASR